MSEIVKVRLSAIDPNPMRQLAVYPYNAEKLASLRRSIHDVGLWAGVTGRRSGNRVEIAFGHHRCEAARLELGEDTEVPIILRQLSDEEMLKLMGRENMEDYNADFLVLLETWEAAERFLLPRHVAASPKPSDIARLLGWTRPDTSRPGTDRADDAANACASASELIQGCYLERADLAGLTVRDAHNVVDSVISRHRITEKTAHIGGYTAEEVAEAKRVAAKAGIATANDVRAGRIAKRDIRGTVDVHASEFGLEVNRKAPLFEAFAARLIDQITRLANADAVAKKLQIIVNALDADAIEMEEDIETVRKVGIVCRIASERLAQWQQTLTNPEKRVAPPPLKRIGSRS